MVAPATYDRKTTPQAEDGDASFSGLNSRLEPDKLPPGYLAAAVNVRMRNGQIEPRKGLIKPGWLNVIAPGVNNTISPVGKFYGSGEFRDPSSVEWTFTAADGQIFRHRPHNARFAVPLPMGVGIFSRVTFTQAFNKLYCFRGKYLAPLVLPDVDTGFVDVVNHWSSATVYKAAIVSTGQVADEIAYGPFQTIASLTSVGDLATVVTSTIHGYVTGADITIQGANETGYNGRWNITVKDDVTFTFLFQGASASPATGSPVCSNMSKFWKALGSIITLNAGELTSVGTTATVTHTAHGFSTGQYVTIAGATPAAYNGTYQITVTGANTFTYVFAGSGTSPATGTITAQTSVVLAGQSPDTNAAAWQQIYNVLPNADDALYINNRLLVPTAYTPGTLNYDSTSSYTKKDFIVATDILDTVHFDFQNEFRINQGSDDEIVKLVKYAQDSAIVIKGKSWGVLSNIGIDLTGLTLDMHTDGYGGCAPSAVVAGKDVLFPVSKRGIVSIEQNQLGQMRSVDIPFTNDITVEVGRINWNYADKIRLAYWDDKLYCAVPLDDGRLECQSVLIVSGAGASAANGVYYQTTELVHGIGTTNAVMYAMRNSNNYIQLQNGAWQMHVVPFGHVFYTAPQLTGPWSVSAPYGTGPAPSAAYQTFTGVNNAMLVYDYRAGMFDYMSNYTTGHGGAWQCVDSGDGICPQEFFKATYNGLERLGFIGADGYANIIEEATAGDQHPAPTFSLLEYSAIATSISSRGFKFDTEAQKVFKNTQAVLGVWDAQYSVSTQTGAANSLRSFITDKTFSRFNYIRPFDKAPYVDGNLNNDFATAGRGNYAVYVPQTGLSLGSSGVNCGLFQEITERVPLSASAQRYTQVLVSNAAGRCVVKSITPIAAEGQRRGGTII